MSSGTPAEIHLVVVWDNALPVLDRILAHAERRFTVRDVVRVTWTPDVFRRSLSRLYGSNLPPGSPKERECGTGPFIVVVVEDERPRSVARPSRDAWVAVNAGLLAAKRRYRRWARGSYAVHATLTEFEARKDAMLVLGEGLEELRARAWSGHVRERRRDLLGEPAWASFAELEAALTATVRCVVSAPESGEPVTVSTDDPWWAIRILDPPAADSEPDVDAPLRQPVIAGTATPIRVVTSLDPSDTWRPLETPVSSPSLVDRLAAMARLR